MTTEEKAEELAIKFCHTTDVIKPNKASIKQAIKCVDEILNNPKNYQRGLAEDLHDEFWQTVKQHLEEMK